jgi:hypothetical protein
MTILAGVTAAGCITIQFPEGHAADSGTVPSTADLALAPDLAAPSSAPDLAVTVSDLATTASDLALAPDLGAPPDLTPPEALAWVGDYETADLTQWHAVQQMGTDRTTFVTAPLPVRQGSYALRYELRSGDQPLVGCCSGTERVETLLDVAGTGGTEAADWYFAWSTLVPSDPNVANGFVPGLAQDTGLLPSGAFNIIQQFHNLDPCADRLAIGLDGMTGDGRTGKPSFYVTVMKYDTTVCTKRLSGAFVQHLAEIQYDRWYDFVLHVRFSSDPSIGFIELWLDGAKVVDKTYGQNMINAHGVYLKQGFYRSAYPRTNVIYHDGVRRGPSLASVLAPR